VSNQNFIAELKRRNVIRMAALYRCVIDRPVACTALNCNCAGAQKPL